MRIKKEPEKNAIELELLENSNNNIEEKEENRYKLYGNDINIKKPKMLGKLRALLYINDYPLIIIGPHSKQLY